MEKLTLEQVILNNARPPERTAPSKPRRRFPLWAALVADVVIAGALLCMFALFHHVIPQEWQSSPPPSVSTPSDEEVTDTSMGAKFRDKFTDTVQRTAYSYTSPNIAITVEQRTQGEGKSLITYYVADIYLRTMDCFRTALAKDTYGRGVSEPLLDIASANKALLAISGDYYGRHYGPVIRNGILYRNTDGGADVCALYRDGTLKTFAKGTFNAEAEQENGAWQVWSFGPALLNDNGSAKTNFNSSLTSAHPRCAIGYYEPGHYVFVLVDGRQAGYSAGMSLKQLSSLFESLGCTAAYNMDGGRTAMMAFGNEVVNRPYKNGREVSDIVYIGEVDTP